MILCSKSGEKPYKAAGRTIYWGENDFRMHYFSPDFKVYSDKMAKLSFAVMKIQAERSWPGWLHVLMRFMWMRSKIWPVTILKFTKLFVPH
jgi:hypothetical protein